MNNKTNRNRREFMKLLARGSAAGVLGSVGQMTLMNEAVAAAPDFSGEGYKAMVCIFFKGGNDSFNMFIPTTSAGHATYSGIRTDLAVNNIDLGLASAFANGSLGKGTANPYNVNGTEQRAYTKGVYDLSAKGLGLGVNGVMPEMAQLITDNKLSIVANVGNLVKPVTREEIRAKTADLPLFLFAHDHQQREMQTGQADKLDDIGWAGKIADSWAGINNNSSFGLNMSYSGNDRMLIGNTTSPLVLKTGSLPSFSGMRIDEGSYDDNRRALFKSLSGIARGASNTSELNLPTGLFDNNKPFKRLYSDMMDRSMGNFDTLSTVWNDNPLEYTSKGPYGEDLFANPSAADLGFSSGLRGSLFKQLESVAKMVDLGARDAFNTGDYKRQIFFVSMGGFDTHGDQANNHPKLLREISLGLWKFQTALEELGHAKKVTTFSMSDFGRTVSRNSSGTDHAWGAHHFVMGGAGDGTSGSLDGGKIIGQIPDLSLEGPNDFSNKGRIIPTTAQDQLNATICEWFGVDESLISTIFPNIENFQTGADVNSAFLDDMFV